MSCVIGLIDHKKVYIAADGLATTEDGEARPIIAIKIFKKGPYLVGFAGSIRTGQIIQRSRYAAPKSIWGWPDIIREQITEKGAMYSGEGHSEMQGSNFVIAHKGKLYEILSDFQINEVNETGFTSIGSGSMAAYGSLFTSKDMGMTPEERLTLALDSASFFVKSCGPPYVIEVL